MARVDIDFTGNNVFVAGGTSGINLGIAEGFAAAGARVAAMSRNQQKVDVLISGAAGNFTATALDMSPNAFKSVIDIDLRGTFHVLRTAYPLLRRPGAVIINVSAPQAFLPMVEQAHVCAAKAGVDMLTRVLALQWGSAGIRVNSVVPGAIEGTEGMDRLAPNPETRDIVSRIIPAGRWGTPRDLAQACLMLASPLADYITGVVLPVDGGWALGGVSTAMAEIAPLRQTPSGHPAQTHPRPAPSWPPPTRIRATFSLAALDDPDTEAADLDDLVASLSATDWTRATPAPGWSIAHQVAHLSWTDKQAVLAITDPPAFTRCAAAAAATDRTDVVEAGAAAGARLQPSALLERWRSGRAGLSRLLGAVPAGSRIPWFGPPMSVASMATARIRETWAHGQDIADTPAFAGQRLTDCVTWLTSVSAPVATRIKSTAAMHHPRSSASNLTRPTVVRHGTGGQERPQTASAAPPSTSGCWKLAAVTVTTWPSLPKVTTPTPGWTSLKRSPDPPASGGDLASSFDLDRRPCTCRMSRSSQGSRQTWKAPPQIA